MLITNTSAGRLILQDGRGLEPGENAEVEASVLDNVVIAAWVESGMASIADGDGEPSPEPEPQPKGKKK